MITGTYPCCGGDLMIAVPEETPKMLPEECPHCGMKVWHFLSRIDPKTYTEEQFLGEFVVDHETKTITRRS